MIGGSWVRSFSRTARKFGHGFRLFDRNFGFVEGVDPDQWRQLPSLPFSRGVGGAGPRDVDVQRLVDFDSGTSTTVPFSQTNSITRPLSIPHIHGVSAHHIFGIGLFAEVPDAYLETIAILLT